ncbi:MAG: APC family permease [Lachnospiraceae bacterium]|nr:APC family permease [Lachnospiraceae bacterium]
MNKKKLGIPSAIATGVGLILATSCLLVIGQGVSAIGTSFIFSVIIALIFNAFTAVSVGELDAIMPELTGGLAQYSLVGMGAYPTCLIMVGGYIIGMTVFGSLEGTMFGRTMSMLFPHAPIPLPVYGIVMMVIIIFLNCRGVDMFAKVQNVVAYSLITSLIIMGVLGCLHMGQGELVIQDLSFHASFRQVIGLVGTAFYMFVGCEFVVPLGPYVKNPRKTIPIGMIGSLIIVFIMQAFCVFGFPNYVSFQDLGSSGSPHMLYGIALLGNVGRYWMGIVSILAVISTVNTVISSIGYLMAGMARIRLLPPVFMKKNKHGAPQISILTIGIAMTVLVISSLMIYDLLNFFLKVACIFWIIVYLFLHIDVIKLRFRMPNVPRAFKAPFGLLIPILGIAGDVLMLYGIDNNPAMRLKVYLVCLICFVILGIYSYFWVKNYMKRPFFEPYTVKEVMAMEDDKYFKYHLK